MLHAPWLCQKAVLTSIWLQFGTKFQEMDALSGRQQTTQGIWMAHSPKISHPLTLILDLEGSDGHERGEDDSSFERQSSLFALAVADVLLVNMWAKDVGRETGAGKPLLKTIFQVLQRRSSAWCVCTGSEHAHDQHAEHAGLGRTECRGRLNGADSCNIMRGVAVVHSKLLNMGGGTAAQKRFKGTGSVQAGLALAAIQGCLLDCRLVSHTGCGYAGMNVVR